MFEKEFCHQSVWELTRVNMQLNSFKTRALLTDQCSVSFAAIILSHFLSISPGCSNQTMDTHIKIQQSYFGGSFLIVNVAALKGIRVVDSWEGESSSELHEKFYTQSSGWWDLRPDWCWSVAVCSVSDPVTEGAFYLMLALNTWRLLMLFFLLLCFFENFYN